MPYSLTTSTGTPIPASGSGVPDGTIDTTSTSIALIGKNVSNYGQFVNENFVHLLENFANSSKPNAPIAGQLWWDKTARQLKVWTDTSWKVPPVVAISNGTAPTVDTSSQGGDLWWDTSVIPTGQLKVFNGATWIAVGPFPGSSSSGSSTSGIGSCFTATAFDTLQGAHTVSVITIGGTDPLAKIIAIISEDTFTLYNIRIPSTGTNYQGTALSGFSTIVPGVNYSFGLATTTLQSLIVNNTTANSAVVYGTTSANVITANVVSGPVGNFTNINSNVANFNAAFLAVTTAISANATVLTSAAVSRENNIVSSIVANTAAMVANITAANTQIATHTANIATLLSKVYSNANVASYLVTNTGNVAAGNIQTNNLYFSNGMPFVSASIVNRANVSVTTASIAAQANANVILTGYKGYNLYAITTSAAAWVNVYSGNTAANVDYTRTISSDPTPNSGVIAEVITSSTAAYFFTPAVSGYTMDGTTNIPLRVNNQSASTQAITVTLTMLKLEG